VNDVADRVRPQTTRAFHEALDIDRPKLIERHEAGLLVLMLICADSRGLLS
jgi:hypothetical protein